MENKKYLQEEIIRISGVNPSKCMRCGKCSATCPAYDEMEYHPHQFVNMVESGEYNPTLALCIKICEALGCTLNDLFWDGREEN